LALPHLTFDDGPSGYTDELLDILARHGVRATFFVLGERVAHRALTVRRAVDEGHAIGNHSWDHPRLTELGQDEIREQLARTSAAIAAAVDREPDVFRPPFGATDATVERVAGGLGMRQVLWDVDTEDWSAPGQELVLQRMRHAKPGEIMLLHDGAGESSADTVRAVEAYLSGSA
jgi:peptidoglycan/xylan/chitin deacetylase (PgdA/CDA1 family)